jgi:alpha-1,2-mannosyltransferase
MGSTRNAEDLLLLEKLIDHARIYCEGNTCTRFSEKKDASNPNLRSVHGIHFLVDCPYSEVKRQLSVAAVGLHTMWNEHFGISIVEMMAAGLIVVAHNSGGPKMDILRDLAQEDSGFLATTIEEYADSFKHIFDHDLDQDVARRHRVRESADRFSDQVFSEAMVAIITKCL